MRQLLQRDTSPRQRLVVFLGLDILEERRIGREPFDRCFHIVEGRPKELLAKVLGVHAGRLEFVVKRLLQRRSIIAVDDGVGIEYERDTGIPKLPTRSIGSSLRVNPILTTSSPKDPIFEMMYTYPERVRSAIACAGSTFAWASAKSRSSTLI